LKINAKGVAGDNYAVFVVGFGFMKLPGKLPMITVTIRNASKYQFPKIINNVL
jgi:hypothetical protein